MNPELQEARKAAIISKIVKYTVMGIVGMAVASCTVHTMSGLEKILDAMVSCAIFASMTGVVFAAFSKNRAYAAFSALYKREAITAALKGTALYEEMEFDYDAGLNPSVVRESGLFTTNRYSSNCFLKAKHNGISFVQADVRNVRGSRNGFSLEFPTFCPAILLQLKTPSLTSALRFPPKHPRRLMHF